MKNSNSHVTLLDFKRETACALLVKKRGLAARKVYAQYLFGDGNKVEDASCWQTVGDSDEWKRSVIVRKAHASAESATEQLSFTVRFATGLDIVSEVYALDARGNIWGSAHDAVLDPKYKKHCQGLRQITAMINDSQVTFNS